MSSKTPYQPHSTSSPGNKNTEPEEEEQGRKPKKVNSEIRKQQNRIASRNYREKRKRKLQYLQRLLKDGESPEQAAQTIEEAYRERTVTPECQSQRPPAPNFVMPPNASFHPLGATSGNAIDPTLSSLTMPFGRQFDRTTHNYPDYDNAWGTQMYSPSSDVNITAWTVPNWIPNVQYTASASSRPEGFRYTPSSHSHYTFERLSAPPHQSRTPGPELFDLGSYGNRRGVDSHQTMEISTVSLPSSASSSPFQYTTYDGVS